MSATPRKSKPVKPAPAEVAAPAAAAAAEVGGRTTDNTDSTDKEAWGGVGPGIVTGKRTAARAAARQAAAMEGGLLLPCQLRWKNDLSRKKIAEKSRQIGWTWLDAQCSVEEVCVSGAKRDVWVTSRDELQARLYVEDAKAWARAIDRAARDLGEVVVDSERNLKAQVLEFPTSRRIFSMSSNFNAQAGKRGSRKADEFALHPAQRELYGIMMPGTQWGGNVSIFSTHRGSGTFFNHLIREVKEGGNPKGFSLHTITLEMAVREGLLRKLKAKWDESDPRQDLDEDGFLEATRAEQADEEMWQQEFCCVPSSDEAAFLSYDLITPCQYAPGEAWEIPLSECAGELYLGVDVARTRNLTVFWVLEKYAGMLLTRKVLVSQNQTFSAQEAILDGLLREPNMRRACIDRTGLGMQFAERAGERFGGMVEGVLFSGPAKEGLAYPVRAAFEDRTLRIPGDRETEADLRSVRKTITAAGSVRFDADNSEKRGHADRFWGLALAIEAAKSGGGEFHFSPVRGGTNQEKLNRLMLGRGCF